MPDSVLGRENLVINKTDMVSDLLEPAVSQDLEDDLNGIMLYECIL